MYTFWWKITIAVIVIMYKAKRVFCQVYEITAILTINSRPACVVFSNISRSDMVNIRLKKVNVAVYDVHASPLAMPQVRF